MSTEQKAAIKLGLLLIAALAYWFYPEGSFRTDESTVNPEVSTNAETAFKQLVKQKSSGSMVEVSARVYKLLSDDTIGDRHQRFLVDVDGFSVLVAHNIDLAPRVPIMAGDPVRIKGEYEWNEKGGVIHWTHHDPKKWHEDGWVDHKGKKFK